MKTCSLKVNIHIHCDGCKRKVKKILQKVEGNVFKLCKFHVFLLNLRWVLCKDCNLMS
ncbi:putative heavy metal-associated domain superfamily [Helianthus annuus]|nr:putative heavy metal-associated domain superfamily [Helianthus annuus]KAJ0958212.1 putative heavy metal-associated domain superfamily [Helianthus annuus]